MQAVKSCILLAPRLYWCVCELIFSFEGSILQHSVTWHMHLQLVYWLSWKIYVITLLDYLPDYYISTWLTLHRFWTTLGEKGLRFIIPASPAATSVLGLHCSDLPPPTLARILPNNPPKQLLPAKYKKMQTFINILHFTWNNNNRQQKYGFELHFKQEFWNNWFDLLNVKQCRNFLPLSEIFYNRATQQHMNEKWWNMLTGKWSTCKM